MELKRIDHKLTVCKVKDVSSINLDADFYFIGRTDEELSLVCKQKIRHKIRSNVMMNGEVFAFRESWTFH